MSGADRSEQASPADATAGDDETPLKPLTSPREGVPDVIATESALQAAIEALRAGTGVLAVDAERASGYRYGQRAFLVQLRREGAGTILIDPTALPDLRPLGEVIDGIEWVLHAASQDLPCLRELGLNPSSLFDTELAARLLGRARVGLGSLIAGEFGLALAKEHSAADWSTRPLPESWLRYAALDVELLVPLRDQLAEQLEAAGKLEWALQEFEAVRLARPVDRPDPWRRTSGIQSLRSPRGLAAVRELWQARDDLARRLDRSPGRVLPDSAIVAAASAMPADPGALRALPGFTGRGAARHLDTWFAAVERARTLAPAQLPARRREGGPDSLPPPRSWADKDPAAARRLDAVRGCVRALAEELEVPQENLLAPAAQRQLAWHVSSGVPSDVAQALAGYGARPWQVDVLAAPLADALAGAVAAEG